MYGGAIWLSLCHRLPAYASLLIFAGMLTSGCALHKPRLDEVMHSEGGSGERNVGVPEHYLVHYPDVLEVSIPGRTDGAVRCGVGLDGRLEVRSSGFVRVEGESPAQIAESLSEQTGIPASEIQVHVAEYRSQHIYVGGPGVTVQRAVPYQGPETVCDFLERIGGVKAGAEPTGVHVIRDGITESRPPQVFQVDLKAVLLDHNQSTNIRLQPYDQVYVGETRASFVEHCIPRWVRPLYDKLCGLPRSRIRKHDRRSNASESASADED